MSIKKSGMSIVYYTSGRYLVGSLPSQCCCMHREYRSVLFIVQSGKVLESDCDNEQCSPLC